MNRDPKNHIGSQILNWCKARNMSYGYACATKKQRSLEAQVKVAQRLMNDFLVAPTTWLQTSSERDLEINPIYPPDDPRRYA